MTPRDFAIDFIKRWEDGSSTDPVKTHSLDPVDNGNWTGGASGLGKLVGSNHGVTPAALALHRGASAASITRDAMHALTLGEAADIALAHYFKANHFDLLPWNRVTMSAFDMVWGAGDNGIKLLQRLTGVGDDGEIGPKTASAVAAWMARLGEEAAARAYADARKAYYDRIIAKRPANKKYRNGWFRRTEGFLPGTPWWGRAA